MEENVHSTAARAAASNTRDEGINKMEINAITNFQNPRVRDSKKLTVEEKREIIKERLKNNFPTEYIFHFAVVFIQLGLVEIGLQIALICYKAPFYYIGNGIWGGTLVIINGLLKYHLCKFKLSFFSANIVLEITFFN